MDKSANAFIKDIVNSPIGIKSGANLTDTINKLLTHKISRLIITDSQKPIGIVSEKDILTYLYKEKLHKSISEVSVNEIMHDIFFINGISTITEASQFMIDNRCSPVAIDSPDNFVGIVTKTDLTKFYWKNHLGKNKVSNHMSVNYFSAFNNDALYDVIKTMLGFGISRMIITDRKRKPLGIISTGNIFRTVLDMECIESTKKSLELGNYQEFWSRYGEFCAQPAEKVMSRGIITVRANEDLANACQIIIEKEINALGVEDSDGQLAGILGKRDVLLALASMH
jgi:predicted transcriptional regulator